MSREITAVMVVKGNPPHINEALDSVKNIAEEIIITDIGMDPSLETMVSSIGKIKVIKIDKPLPYVELIREELKAFVKTPYLIFLDPDEILPASLIKILKEKLYSFDYLRIPRKNIIFGKWIRNAGWWPDYQVRVFKKNAAKWPTEIHKQPEVKGKGLELNAKEELAIIHYNYSNLDEFLEKYIRYAKSDATYCVDHHKEITLSETVKKSLHEFISKFFALDGYKEGMYGFALSTLQMFYYFLVYFYFWEIKKYPTIDSKSLVEESRNFFKQGLLESNHWTVKKHLTDKLTSIKMAIIEKLLK